MSMYDDVSGEHMLSDASCGPVIDASAHAGSNASFVNGYLRISLHGKILDVNGAYSMASGYSREELLCMSLSDLDDGTLLEKKDNGLLDIISQKKGCFDVVHRTKDGALLEMKVSSTYVDHPEPFFVFILENTPDPESSDCFFSGKGDLYHSLFKDNKAIMLVIDPVNFDIIDANVAACDFYGWPLEVITRMKIHEINTLSVEKISDEMQNAVSEKRNYFLFKHRLADGNVRDVEVYSSPVIANSRDLLYSVIHDITDRKKAEDELMTREMQLRTAQKIGHIGSWSFDLKNGDADASEEARIIYGYGLDGGRYLISEVQSIALPEYRSYLNESMRALIEDDATYDVQFKIKRANDGAIRDVHVVAEYSNEKNMVIGTIEDITERKKAEDSLLHAKMLAEAANRSKDEFLATMSHELRTPLTSVIGFSDVLLDETFGSLEEKQAGYVKHIADAGKHLLKLINDVLDLSKVEAGKMELQYEVFHAGVAVNEVQTLLSPLARNKRINIGVDVDADVVSVNADRTKFKQILYNLASNAIKFTPEKGSVLIKAQCSDNFLVVSVKDTGIGLSKEDQDKLFHPFEQLRSYVADEYAGTGLGLALVKKFVELHDGRIWVDSKVGEGSTFYFSMPLGLDLERTAEE
ncbi:PAS domain-containing protein [Methanolobus profundi]|uniref:histidine kinase n=2 Tax=Methanolobus profundi TaxID=487685 RepID=A0A1I4TJK3_9EURY|nr:PAS domain-containing protein [Methanolobus profundi]